MNAKPVLLLGLTALAIPVRAADLGTPVLAMPVSPVAAPAPAVVASAEAFLAGINPRFDAAPVPGDTPELLELKGQIRAARQIVAQARVAGMGSSVSRDGRVSAERLENAYDGGKDVLPLAKDLTGPAGEAIRDMISDGAPLHARQALERLGRRGAGLRRLVESLDVQPPSPAVASFSARLREARAHSAQGSYGEAQGAVGRLLEDIEASSLLRGTKRVLSLEALRIRTAVVNAGRPALQKRLGPMTAPQLLERLQSLAAGDYVGNLISGAATRIQRHEDCAVQQLYNHPRLAAISETMSYPQFLRAVEGLLRAPIRKEGLSDEDSQKVLRELGFKRSRLRSPKSEDELARALDEDGVLLATIWLDGPRKVKEAGDGLHATLLHGAYREDGAWRFVVIDSNHLRPRILSFDELQVLSAGQYDFVEALPGVDPARAARLFRERYGRGYPFWRRWADTLLAGR